MFRLKELREEKKLSLDDLSKALNVNKSTLSRIENELREPKKSFIEDCAKYFDVSVDYLLGIDEAKHLSEVDADILELVNKINALDKDTQHKIELIINAFLNEEKTKNE